MTQNTYCNFTVDRDYPDVDIYLQPEQNYKLIIDYPCNKTIFDIYTGVDGMGLMKLVKVITDCYKQIYKEAETTNPYGVWGHGIEDLAIECIKVDYSTKVISLGVGS